MRRKINHRWWDRYYAKDRVSELVPYSEWIKSFDEKLTKLQKKSGLTAFTFRHLSEYHVHTKARFLDAIRRQQIVLLKGRLVFGNNPIGRRATEEIIEWIGADIPEYIPQEIKASKETLDKAQYCLERNGYTVIPPKC